MNEKAQFSARLKVAMIAAGHEARPTVLEKQLNSRYWGRSVSFQAASRWLGGKSIPSQEKLQILAEWLAVEPQALRFGEQAIGKIREQRGRWDVGLKSEEREILEVFLALPALQKKIAREVILALAKK
jgi:transcriptional regulator with XRE-family HTH domain